MSDIKLEKRPRVALLVTCLVDLFRPSVGFAAVKLLQDAGCSVDVPESQTCCGQPAYNSGDRKNAADIALDVIEAFEAYDYVVAPSGSCAGMLRKHYPGLFEGDRAAVSRAQALADKSYELTSFLTDVLEVETVDAALDATITYHDSCAGLRELGVKRQPRALLASVKGLSVSEYDGAEECCGFGGTFCVKYSEISDHMVSARADQLAGTKADVLLGGDLGCLMNIAGKLSRQGSPIQVRHVAEVLAGDTAAPAICEADK